MDLALQSVELYKERGYRELLHMSDYGYWVLPSGTVLVLIEGMTHGKIVEEYVKNTSDQSSLEVALAYERAKQPDIKKSTVADLWACNTLGWIRINISQYSDAFQVSWSQKIMERAKETLRMMLDEHDLMNDEISTDYGSVIGWDGLKKKLENPVYWRQGS